MTGMRHATLAEQAYEELKYRIMSGRLPAGQRLLAEELASELAISQTPVKEALAELARDGLVEGGARRTSTVRRFTAADIAAIYEARILIETHAVAAALRARRVDAPWLDMLEAILAANLDHAERRNPADLAEAIRLDREFHEAIVERGGNPVLTGCHRLLVRQTQTFRSYTLESYDIARARAEHGEIVRTLRAGKRAAAVKALRVHLIASRDEMLSRPAGALPPRP